MRKLIVTLGMMGFLLHTMTDAAASTGGGIARGDGASPIFMLASLARSTTFDMPKAVKVLTPPDPPVGQDYFGSSALVVPAAATWRLVAFTFNVTFDVSKPGAGNVSIVVRDPDGVAHLRIPLANGLDRASRYVDFSAWIGAPQGPSLTFDHECIVASIPDLTLPAGWQITTLVDGRRTTDRVKEMQLWVEENPA